jgi:hypothetical protein
VLRGSVAIYLTYQLTNQMVIYGGPVSCHA